MKEILMKVKGQIKILEKERSKKQTEIECICNEINRLELLTYDIEKKIEEKQTVESK